VRNGIRDDQGGTSAWRVRRDRKTSPQGAQRQPHGLQVSGLQQPFLPLSLTKGQEGRAFVRDKPFRPGTNVIKLFLSINYIFS
jgi:hypothetical protein